MTTTEFFDIVAASTKLFDFVEALNEFEAAHAIGIKWIAFGGRENNKGTIEAAGDPGRSIVERITNGIDAILDAEHESHNGMPVCRSPKEAAASWLAVPPGGLSQMTDVQRRSIAKKISAKIFKGEGKESRVVEVRDLGIGLTPQQMPNTILSLNESNKVQKHYLVGAYGQGGSSTFAASKYTLIASRYNNHPLVGFTIVRYVDLPAEEYKIGHYVYLTFEGSVLTSEIPLEQFQTGTLVKHFGYDLSSYSAPLGPSSLYGLFQQVLFDPVLPMWLDDFDVHGYRRVIKGSRNALNGAVDEGDEAGRGPNLEHNMRMFYVGLGEFGRIGIEYWVLESLSSTNKNPIQAFVNSSKPIILTINGQNHAELSQALVRKQAELPYLVKRLICHIDCDHLTPQAKRSLFVSNREEARRGIVHDLIQQEIVKVLKSDDTLVRLNNEARERGLREHDENAVQQMRSEVARLLRLQGIDIGQGAGVVSSQGGVGTGRPPQPPRPPRPPRPPLNIELHEPPTYIKIIWDQENEITFYPEQRRYLRIETDAFSSYHNPNDPTQSRINIIATNGAVLFRGSTPLEAGRMRVIFEGASNARISDSGLLRIELSRPGLLMLSDEHAYRIVNKPPVREATLRLTLPQFDIVKVDGTDDVRWTQLGWPDNIRDIASAAEMENGILTIYYSAVYPKYAEQRSAFERRDVTLAESYTKRYEIWIAVHSLLLHQAEQEAETQGSASPADDDVAIQREQAERCRIATLAALFSAREVQLNPDRLESE